jgi:hypothetical protein
MFYWQVPFTQARAPQQPAPDEQLPPALRQQFRAPSALIPFDAQIRSPQQCAPAAHTPPSFRQQLRTPSEAIPLLAQVTAPPLWEHWPLAVHSAPSGRLTVTGPVQTPPLQVSAPQQPEPLAQAPPAFRQQLSAPSLGMPLEAQTVTPPV